MNEKFFALPREKQARIINAAYKAFGEAEYKNTSTEEIAKEAGISKSLLFHYFGSKKELYVFLFDFTIKYAMKQFRESDILAERDYFKMILKSRDMKSRMCLDHPYLMHYVMRSYYEDNSEVLGGIQLSILKSFTESARLVSENVDREKFRDEADIEPLNELITLYSEAYMRRIILSGKPIDIENVNKDTEKLVRLLKRRFYKEEFADDDSDDA